MGGVNNRMGFDLQPTSMVGMGPPVGGVPQRGFAPGLGGVNGMAPTTNDLSALVNANLALAQQNLALAGSHHNPDNGYIRLGKAVQVDIRLTLG